MIRPAPAGRITVAVAVAAGLWAAGPVAGQMFVAETAHHGFSIGDASLFQSVLPVGVTWRPGRVRVDANTALGWSRYARDGESSELAGLTDLTLRVMVPFFEDRARVVLAANLPTGIETLSDDQLPVAGFITHDLFVLPVRSFGNGSGLTSGVALAQPVGDWVAGGIVIYRIGAAYEPIAATATRPAMEFRPGSEMRMRIGLDRPRVGAVSWRLATSWSRFTPDAVPDGDFFARGDRFLAEANAEFPLRRGTGMLYGWTLHRTRGEILLGPEPLPLSATTLIGIGGRAVQPVSPRLTVRPRAELLYKWGDDEPGSGVGWVTRVGSAASVRRGSLRFDPAVMLQAGVFEGETLLGLVLRGGVLWAR